MSKKNSGEFHPTLQSAVGTLLTILNSRLLKKTRFPWSRFVIDRWTVDEEGVNFYSGRLSAHLAEGKCRLYWPMGHSVTYDYVISLEGREYEAVVAPKRNGPKIAELKFTHVFRGE